MQRLFKSFEKILRPGFGQMETHAPRIHRMNKLPNIARQNEKALPKISIVIPSFNQGKFIEQTLKSVIDQSYPNLELILVDGGSTDNTLDIIKKYEKYFTWWVSEPDTGQTAAINKGFEKSSGEIMAWLNSDDLMISGVLRLVADYFANNPDVQVVYGNRILINEDGLEVGRWTLPNHSDRVLKWIDFVPQETLYWSREAWNRTGSKLDEKFQFAMDWDFLLRLSAIKIKMHHLPLFLGMFRIHRHQKTSSQMSTVGQKEIQLIRYRELGFYPKRWQVHFRTLPYLLLAKLQDLGLTFNTERIGNA